MASEDASPMDMAHYPSRSRMQNLLEADQLAANKEKMRIKYSRPQMKGRKIFGELLPYGELWRLGANETTTITLYTAATIGNVELKKGTYGLFAKVNKDNWEIIIHRSTNSWGHANHDEEDNIGTVIIPVQKTKDTLESFTTTFEESGDKVNILFGWENTMVRLPVVLK